MSYTLVIIIVALLVVAALVIAWIISISRTKSSLQAQIMGKDARIQSLETVLETKEAQYERMLSELRSNHERELNGLRESNAKAIESARTALALENEKTLKAREEALKKEAAETIKAITGGLDKDIKDMKDAFDAHKRTQVEESASIKTQFAETVRNLKAQTDSISSKAETLASALKGKNKMQGIFGETILENILKDEGMRNGHDYDTESWLRDTDNQIIANDNTGKKMRPDFVLHFPDDTDILLDAKVSLSALADYFEAATEEQRADARARNLESVMNHINELSGKEYQKYVKGRKTLDYVIMFIPNYGAYQLAKQEDKDIFAKAFRKNVLITTEETLIPFIRLIRTAWKQKEQMDNIEEIVNAAQTMVDRVGLFCEENAKIQTALEGVLGNFKKNSLRLKDGRQSIVGAAMKAIEHGINKPKGHALPPISNLDGNAE